MQGAAAETPTETSAAGGRDAALEPVLSIIVPMHNEEENVEPLISEVAQVMSGASIAAELIIVDDGSTDATLARLRDQKPTGIALRVLHRAKGQGQSAATYAGIHAARAPYIATLDGDMQNDPADLPAMLEVVKRGDADMAQGVRQRRADTLKRKFSSWVGRTTRKLLLGDDIRDTGCATRVVATQYAKQIPLQFRGMHRFIPVYTRMLGARVVEMPVNHRPRVAGRTKYGMLNRGLVGLFDCLAMRWMLRRFRDAAAESVSKTKETPCEAASV